MKECLLIDRRLFSLLAVVGAFSATAIGVTFDIPFLPTVGVLALTLSVWLLLVSMSDELPAWATLILAALVFASLLPEPIALVIEGLALVVPFLIWARAPKEDRRGAIVVLATAAAVLLWFLLIFHPNVPELVTGLRGARKTILALSGLVLGCALHSRYRESMELYMARLIVVALTLSIIIHLWVPRLAGLVARDADQYTSLFKGEPRLEGLFVGPFHVAAACVLVMGWAVVRFRQRPVFASVAIAVSSIGVYLTMVRSAYVAIALVLIVALVISRPSRRTILIVLVSGLASALVVTGLAIGGLLDLRPVLSIFELGTDGRLLNRFPGYSDSLRMIGESPFVGWGAGAAGDTLGDEFSPAHQHVTSHNLVLKILVEGGLVGAICWGWLAISLVRSVRWREDSGKVALIALAGLLAFGLVGSAIEALPVTFILLAFVGLAVRDRDKMTMSQAGSRGP